MTAPTMFHRLAAEMIGTFWLVLGGCGSAVFATAVFLPEGISVGIGLLGVAIAFGLTVLTGVYAFGTISGGHFNPAVTLGAALAKRVEWKALPAYWTVQVIGGLLAGLVIYLIAKGKQGFSATGNMAANGFGAHSPGGYSLSAVIVTEVVLTFVFLLVILGSTDDRAPKGLAGLAIGLTLTVIHLVSLPISNTSVNPARSTGVAFFNGNGAPAQLWVFWLAPLIGAAIAGIAYPYLFGKREQLAERPVRDDRLETDDSGKHRPAEAWSRGGDPQPRRRPPPVPGSWPPQLVASRAAVITAARYRRQTAGRLNGVVGFDRDVTSPGRRGARHCDRRHPGCSELSGEPGQRRSERRRR